MSERCPKCGNKSLMFSNIGALMGIKPWCLICGEGKAPKYVYFDTKGNEEE